MTMLFKAPGAAALICAATMAPAQQVTQSSVAGATGDPVYTVSVIGSNGVQYACRPDLVERDGQTVRLCRRGRPDDDGGVVVGRGENGTLWLAGVAGIAAVAAIMSSEGTD